MSRRAAYLLLLLALGSPATAAPSAAPAARPKPASGGILGGHDSNAPVDVNADRIEVQDRADRAIFSGNVRAKQGDMTLNAARITVAYSKPPAGSPPGTGTQIDRLDATGGVVVTNPSERATGDYAIYDLNRKLVTMLGNVVLVRAGNTVRGGRAVLDLSTNRATVDGSAVGGAAGTSAAPGGRVSGRFTVPQQKPGT